MSKFTDELRGRPNLPSFEALLDYRDEQRRQAADLLDEAEKALDMVVALSGLYGDDEKTLLDEEYQLPEVAAAITTLARIRGKQ